ncbi:MAG TPA: hypothetical protein DCX06_06800 [Opitutae bacterium]|nr:hypothetical protein [Opitutae bacterium]
MNAQNVVVSAKLEARNPNGTPIPVKYVYPVAELASGETGKLHIGELYRFEGVSVVERELGLVLNLTVETEGENVRYYGEAKSTQLADVSETGCSFKATEAYIEGEVLSGESVALWLKGPSDDFEAITLHFAIKDAEPTTDAEPAAN